MIEISRSVQISLSLHRGFHSGFQHNSQTPVELLSFFLSFFFKSGVIPVCHVVNIFCRHITGENKLTD